MAGGFIPNFDYNLEEELKRRRGSTPETIGQKLARAERLSQPDFAERIKKNPYLEAVKHMLCSPSIFLIYIRKYLTNCCHYLKWKE